MLYDRKRKLESDREANKETVSERQRGTNDHNNTGTNAAAVDNDEANNDDSKNGLPTTAVIERSTFAAHVAPFTSSFTWSIIKSIANGGKINTYGSPGETLLKPPSENCTALVSVLYFDVFRSSCVGETKKRRNTKHSIGKTITSRIAEGRLKKGQWIRR